MATQTAFRLKASSEGEEDYLFDVKPDATLWSVMEFLCQKWLDIICQGDGGIYDHVWKISTEDESPAYDYRLEGTLREKRYIHDKYIFQNVAKGIDFFEEFRIMIDQEMERLSTKTKLQDLDVFTSRSGALNVVYDMRYSTVTTYFQNSLCGRDPNQ